MKKWLYLFSALLAPFSKAQTPKLGSDADPIRQMFFAAQPMKELLAHVKLDGEKSPFQAISDASRLADEGKKQDAVARLRGVLETPNLETRIQLWTWTALRELGTMPDSKSAGEVLGVVIEMPSGGAYDTLAAYVDGSARYLNFSGKGIFWDQADPTVKSLCQKFIDSTIPASGRAKPRPSLLLPKSGAQVTLLTRAGIYAFSDPPESVVGAGAALMMELIKRAQAKKE